MKATTFVVIGILTLVAFSIYEDHKYLESLKSGEKTLICQLEQGETVIDPKKIVDVDFETNTFIFTNGSATNCKVVK